ncbi:SNARE domain protein [Ancylostoma duodenale]|uniref:SNARE domain protein n=1 Tax=Ancylostoma duodenale TaxID=51022 RepID=A0A0C2HGD3_9BILA|nr:SNARE domain protein [Ancylostoma duodenale]
MAGSVELCRDVLEDQIAKIRRKTADLRKMVNEVDNEFNEFARGVHIKTEYKVLVRVRRQLRAVGENVTEEEAEKIIDSAGRDELFFREVNPLSVSAKAALADVKRRHNEIVELEKSIQTMQEIFVDLQNLTEIQNEMVDNIAHNVETTKDHVEQGARNVKVGLEYKKSATRKKVGDKCVVQIVGVTCMLALALQLGGKGNSHCWSKMTSRRNHLSGDFEDLPFSACFYQNKARPVSA